MTARQLMTALYTAEYLPDSISTNQNVSIIVQPIGANKIEKEVNENRVHTHNGKKFKITPVVENVDPPITNC